MELLSWIKKTWLLSLNRDMKKVTRVIDSMDKGRFHSYDPIGQYQGFFRNPKTKDTNTIKNSIPGLFDRVVIDIPTILDLSSYYPEIVI